MGVFNFIETFFFISLGITFILILLLVYHFKQRLNTIEQKNDTMFEIINNIVKELNMVKQYSMQKIQQMAPMSMFSSDPTSTHTVDLGNIQEFVPRPGPMKHDPVDDSDSGSEDEDDDADDQEDDQDDDDDTDTDSTVDDVDDDQEELTLSNASTMQNMMSKILVSDDEADDHDDAPNITSTNSSSDSTNSTNSTKIINLEVSDLSPIDLDDITTSIEISKLDMDNEPVSEQPQSIDELVKTEPEPEPILIKTARDILLETYNKMSLNELRAVVIQNGLTTDSGKMKRPKLLQMLEKSLD